MNLIDQAVHKANADYPAVNFARICRPRTAAVGIALIVLAVGMVDQPRPVTAVIDAPLWATTSGRNPIRNSAACEAIVGLPRGSVQAVYNVSAWAPGAWPYWRTICVYKLPPGPTTYRVIS